MKLEILVDIGTGRKGPLNSKGLPKICQIRQIFGHPFDFGGHFHPVPMSTKIFSFIHVKLHIISFPSSKKNNV